MNSVATARRARASAASVHFVSAVWAIAAFAILLKVSTADGGVRTGSGEVAGTFVATTAGHSAPTLLALGAIMMGVLAALLWCGIGRALPGLLGISLLILVIPGVAGIFEAVVLMAAIVLGTLPVLLDGGFDRLTGGGLKR